MQSPHEAPDFERPHNEAPTYPSFLARAAAFLIDWAVVLLLAMFIAFSVTPSETGRLLILLVVLSLYEIGFHVAIGATAGKMALRMHVAGPNGERLDPDKIILRYLIFLVSLLLPLGAAISAALVFMDPQRRALHDRIAGTRVHRGHPAWLQDQP
jgi:uncharacterized RDD family membrane protein YckC